MDLAELKAGVCDVEVTYKGHTFTVGYRPEAVTEDDLAHLETFSEQSGLDILRATIPPLVRLVVRWAITNAGEPLAVDEASVKALPPRMRVEILQGIMSDFFSSGNATTSDAGSPARAESEADVPSTQDSSGTRNGQDLRPGILPDSPIPVGA